MVTSKLAAIMPGYPQMVLSKMAAIMPGYPEMVTSQNGGLQHRNITERSLQKGGLINRGFRASFPNIKDVGLGYHIRSFLDGIDRVYVKGSGLCGSDLCVVDVTSRSIRKGNLGP
jgi:hypothetical protein